jgi:hypothetical protein
VLKCRIQEGTPHLSIIFAGKKLEYGGTLGNYKVPADSRVHLVPLPTRWRLSIPYALRRFGEHEFLQDETVGHNRTEVAQSWQRLEHRRHYNYGHLNVYAPAVPKYATYQRTKVLRLAPMKFCLHGSRKRKMFYS